MPRLGSIRLSFSVSESSSDSLQQGSAGSTDAAGETSQGIAVHGAMPEHEPPRRGDGRGDVQRVAATRDDHAAVVSDRNPEDTW
jgi:hypothetical protein